MTKGIIWKKKSTNTFHPLTTLYMYCHMQLYATILVTIECKWCAAMCLNIWLFILLLLLLFWNDLGHSIQILGWFYNMPRGIKKIRLVNTYVGT
jgi:hypothetical protein